MYRHRKYETFTYGREREPSPSFGGPTTMVSSFTENVRPPYAEILRCSPSTPAEAIRRSYRLWKHSVPKTSRGGRLPIRGRLRDHVVVISRMCWRWNRRVAECSTSYGIRSPTVASGPASRGRRPVTGPLNMRDAIVISVRFSLVR